MTRTPAQTRAILARRKRKCSPKCRGWFICDSDTYGLEVEACDECNSGRGVQVTDADVDLLPEARRELYRRAGKVTITLSGEEWDRLRLMLGAPDCDDFDSEFSVARRGTWMRWVIEHHSKGAV